MLAIAEKPDSRTGNPNISEHQERANEVKAKIRQTLQQAADLQCLAYKVAMDLDLPCSPEEEDGRRARAQAVASAIKAWDISADRIRVLKGKGLPRTVDVSPKSKSKPKVMTFTESKPQG